MRCEPEELPVDSRPRLGRLKRLDYEDLVTAAFELGIPALPPTRADAIAFARQRTPQATVAEASAAYDEWYLQEHGRPWRATEADIEQVSVHVRALLFRESLVGPARFGQMVGAYHRFLGQQSGATFDACWAAITAIEQELGASR